jgi:hypothetical protein
MALAGTIQAPEVAERSPRDYGANRRHQSIFLLQLNGKMERVIVIELG